MSVLFYRGGKGTAVRTLDRMDQERIEVPRGLANVVVTDTALGDVRGREGFFHYRQYSAVELARSRSVEDVWRLLLDGRLPDAAERRAFAAEIAAARIPPTVADLLPAIAAATAPGDPLAGLRAVTTLTGAALGQRPMLDLDRSARRADLVALAATAPVAVAALHRLRIGLPAIPPDPALPFAAGYLFMLTGERPDERVERAVSTYLVAALDHGFNASTFTARVIASTGADAASALTGALGSLSGPLHGGAPARALDTLDAIAAAGDVDGWVRDRLLAGDRIMGFGHPVYRVEDPRSALLKEVARGFGGERVALAIAVEERIPALLERYKPGRHLHTNLEWYAAVVLEACGLDRSLFTPTFAIARMLGWTANVLEQAEDGKIIRPTARYVGPPAPEPVPAP